MVSKVCYASRSFILQIQRLICKCLGQAQEENQSLKTQLEASTQKTQMVASQLRIEHGHSVSKLQQQNDTLAGDVHDGHVVISKLKERQKELVELQSAVIDLWSWCSRSPKFSKFGSDIDVKEPLTMVTATKVLMTSESTTSMMSAPKAFL